MLTVAGCRHSLGRRRSALIRAGAVLALASAMSGALLLTASSAGAASCLTGQQAQTFSYKYVLYVRAVGPGGTRSPIVYRFKIV